MAKKTEETKQRDMATQVIADIMTRNVNLTKEEYADMLKKMGINPDDIKLDSVSEEDRLSRIRQNFYGTMVNMFALTYNQANALMEEIEVFRAQLNAICEKLGIDTTELKTSTDRLNEAAEKYLKKKTNFSK